MPERPPLMQTAQGVLIMHILPPLVAAGIGAFATITILSERITRIEERTLLAQEQIDRRFQEQRYVVDSNKRDIEARIGRIEERLWDEVEQ